MLRPSTSLWIASAILLPTAAHAQVMTFSAQRHGPSIGLTDGVLGRPMRAADVLSPFDLNSPIFPGRPYPGPTTAPGIWQRAGTTPGGLGLTALPAEMDALSHGVDRGLLTQSGPRWFFSVDRFASGVSGVAPDVNSEAPAQEASADVFMDLGLPNGPLHPLIPVSPSGNTDRIDGNGLAGPSGFLRNGTGLLESATDLPDDLDGLDLGLPTIAPLGQPLSTFFSLDAGYTDVLAGPLLDSAVSNGFVGGDVLLSQGGVVTVFAPAFALGLDQNSAGEDDLDALILLENGTEGFQPDTTFGGPTHWGGENLQEATTLPVDILLFSVRRGSAIIGQLDSRFGVPICAGDLLTPPLFGTTMPGIFIGAEHLGLVVNRASVEHADDLDAADAWTAVPNGIPITDCNSNGIDDVIDIATGTSLDLNGNGIPDECDTTPPTTVATYCTWDQNSCSEDSAIAFSGLPTVNSTDPDFHITTARVVPNVNGLLLYSVNGRDHIPWATPGHGFLCIKAPYRTMNAGNSGGQACTPTQPPTGAFDINFSTKIGTPGFGPGVQVNAQFYYLDPGFQPGYQYNLTDAIKFIIQL